MHSDLDFVYAPRSFLTDDFVVQEEEQRTVKRGRRDKSEDSDVVFQPCASTTRALVTASLQVDGMSSYPDSVSVASILSSTSNSSDPFEALQRLLHDETYGTPSASLLSAAKGFMAISAL